MATFAQNLLGRFEEGQSKKLTYYDILEIPSNATTKQVVQAFRRKSLAAHPDKEGGSTQRFQQLNRAYTCLK